MNITHRPQFDIALVEKHYSEKDGVPVKYVCTSSPTKYSHQAVDIFYRETPHPEFGNRYFGLFEKFVYTGEKIVSAGIRIIGADTIEDLDFEMVEVDGSWHYSQQGHDFNSVGDIAIDGGREYCRLVGNLNHPRKLLCVKDGEFVEKTDEVS